MFLISKKKKTTSKKKQQEYKKAKETKKEKRISPEKDLKNKFAATQGKIFLDNLISGNKRLLIVWPKITFFLKLWN